MIVPEPAHQAYPDDIPPDKPFDLGPVYSGGLGSGWCEPAPSKRRIGFVREPEPEPIADPSWMLL